MRAPIVGRMLDIFVGIWLIFSALAWAHTPTQKTTAIVCGALVITLSVISFFLRPVRFALALVALWLGFTALRTLSLREMGEVTPANNVICAAILLGGSLFGREGRRRARARTAA